MHASFPAGVARGVVKGVDVKTKSVDFCRKWTTLSRNGAQGGRGKGTVHPRLPMRVFTRASARIYNKESYDEAAPLRRFARAVPAFVLTAHYISGCTALFCGKYPNQKLETRIEKCKFAKGSSKRLLFTTNETSKRQKQPNCHRFPAHDRHTDTDIHFQSSPLMQHFTRTLFALALSLGTFTAAFAGDGTKKILTRLMNWPPPAILSRK